MGAHSGAGAARWRRGTEGVDAQPGRDEAAAGGARRDAEVGTRGESASRFSCKRRANAEQGPELTEGPEAGR